MKRTILIAALVAGFAGCGKEESKPAPTPAVPITPAAAPTPTSALPSADAAKDAAKTSTEVPMGDASKVASGKDTKK